MTNLDTAPAYTRSHWAKSEPRDGYPKRIHLLEHHLADVGACFEALLAQPTIRQRLARSGGLDVLDEATAARLSLFAALHDIGKVNVGFQTRIWRDADLPAGRRKPGHAGHYHELAPVMRGDDGATTDWFFDNLGWWWDATESWDDCGGETVCALFVAALSHRGQPLPLEGRLGSNPALWGSLGSAARSQWLSAGRFNPDDAPPLAKHITRPTLPSVSCLPPEDTSYPWVRTSVRRPSTSPPRR